MVEGSGKLIKFLMLFINFLLFISGFALIGFGIWTFFDNSFFEVILGSNKYFVAVSILFVIIGILSAVISLVGFCGAYKESRLLLTIYFTFVFIIFGLIIAASVLAFMFRSELDEKMTTELYDSISQYNKSREYTDSWDVVQKYFKCCGVSLTTGPSTQNLEPFKSWEQNNKDFQDKIKVPQSCCKDANEADCNLQENVPQKIYTDDCFLKLKDFMRENSILFSVVAVFVAILLLIAMTLSCSLFCMIKH